MKIFFLITGGTHWRRFMDFKERAPLLSLDEFKKYYIFVEDRNIKRPTDINKKSIRMIMKLIQGKTVLDVGCGRGFLAKKIAEELQCNVTGMDMLILPGLENAGNMIFIEGSLEENSFKNKSFDTVICAHTLEHVLNIQDAVHELRRLCKKRLILVVPKQREYKYTFDLHLHFFPYPYSLHLLMNNMEGKCIEIDNDLLYYEDL